MVKHPPLLILDEPAAGLDDESAVLFTSLVNKIATESNTAILYVSHRVENGLSPDFIFELIPGTDGSTGINSNAKKWSINEPEEIDQKAIVKLLKEAVRIDNNWRQHRWVYNSAAFNAKYYICCNTKT